MEREHLLDKAEAYREEAERLMTTAAPGEIPDAAVREAAVWAHLARAAAAEANAMREA